MFNAEPVAPITSLPWVLGVLVRVIAPAASTCKVPLPVRPFWMPSVPLCARSVPLLVSAPVTPTVMMPPPSELMVPLLMRFCVPPER